MTKNPRAAFLKYARYYDLLYSEKDYKKESDVLEEIFRLYARTKPRSILDAGCGTGSHSIELARRGYRLTGVDASEPMINVAQEKAKAWGVPIDFQVFDLKELSLPKKFDACICMFAAIGYLTSTNDLIRALKKIRSHLHAGGIFVTDFWYGPAVLTIRPSSRTKIVERNGIRLIRTVSPKLEIDNHTCTSEYYLLALKERDLIDEIREVHVMRFFFPQEFEHYLSESGFELVKMCEFLNLTSPPTENSWNAMGIARAI